ncbi:hypothetical protein LJB83_00250 [Clostridia bacterium OttesenSCG-928-F22]|nr:hypothetical protein [Clostridia bacterium OttesenSCG-928-F22]
MNINDLLNELEKELEESSNLPLTSKKIVDREFIMEIINDMKEALPEELSEAKMLVNEKQRILADAQKEADAMMNDVNARIDQLVDETEIMAKAYEKAERVIENAQNTAAEIRLGAQAYADEILQDAERYMMDYLDIIRQNREELKK